MDFTRPTDATVIARQLRAALAVTDPDPDPDPDPDDGPLTTEARERLEITASAMESLAADPVSNL